MKIAVIGGGFTGLATAFLLSKKHSVTVLEKENVLGGLAASYTEKGWSWPLEKYFHHFFTSDKEIINLAKALGIQDKLIIKSPKTSVWLDGNSYRFDNPKSVILFPKLNVLDKFRTAAVSFILKINPFWQPLEKIPAETFIQKTMGKNAFKTLWQPLLSGKFGALAKNIPASWFWTRINKRSFKLGYFEGGFSFFTNALGEKIKKRNGQIMLGGEITKIEKSGDKFTLWLGPEKHPEEFDKVIATLSPSGLRKLAPALSPEEKNFLDSLKSIGTVCLILRLKERFLPDQTYWLNINETGFPFVAVVEHTNFIEPVNYGGEHLVYVGGYYPPDHPFFKMPAGEIYQKFLPYLKKINPAFNFSLFTISYSLFTDSYAQPVIPLRYSDCLPQIKTSVPGLFWGSLHHVYPQDRGVNYAIALGAKITNEVQNS